MAPGVARSRRRRTSAWTSASPPNAAVADTWTIRAEAPREVARAALLAHEDAAAWPAGCGLVGMAIAADRPEEWSVEAYLPTKPTAQDTRRVAALFGPEPPRLAVAALAEQDWVTHSQAGLEPIVAGPFQVRTADF